MGAVLGVFAGAGCLAQLACCFGSAACGLCCGISCKSSTSTRLMYALMLLLGTIAAFTMLTPSIEAQLRKIDRLCQVGIGSTCSGIVGYEGVYRVCFSLACFFLLFAMIMFNVKSSRDFRAKLQNGFWFFKYALLIGIMVGMFYIPYGTGTFDRAMMYLGMIGAFLFILIQLILIVDFAHGWADKWISNYQETGSRGWFTALLSVTLVFYIISISCVVLFYTYYTKADDCLLHKFFISVNLIFCIIASILSVTPKIQEANNNSGLLQASFLTLYVMYLTWSAMSNNPDRECNPSLLQFFYPPGPSNGTSTVPPPGHANATISSDSIVGMFIWLACILYSSIRSASGFDKLSGNIEKDTNADSSNVESGQSSKEVSVQRVLDDEEGGIVYNYSFFHAMFMLASFYVMMSLTNWDSPSEASVYRLNSNMASVWVKIVSSWICMAIYVWTLVAPLVFPDRDFH